MPDYDSPGKRKARDLVTAVFASTGGTVLDFYGESPGRSAVQFVDAGLTVTCAEKERKLHADLARDAELYGYEPHFGRASRLDREFDFVFADFCGNASPDNWEELRRLAPKVRQWMAVTISPDHQINEALQGRAAPFTVPVWMHGATGMRLQYIARYVRDDRGQRMWIALLRPVPYRKGNQSLSGATIARDLERRDYWASPTFRKSFPLLVPHRKQSQTEWGRMMQKGWNAEYYAANRESILQLKADQRLEDSGAARERAKDYYWANHERVLGWKRAWEKANPDKLREYHRRSYQKRKDDPEYIAANRARARAAYLRKKAA